VQDLPVVQDGHKAELRPHAVLKALCPPRQPVPLLQEARDQASDHLFVVGRLAVEAGPSGHACSMQPTAWCDIRYHEYMLFTVGS
jgi:hypothetical protein